MPRSICDSEDEGEVFVEDDRPTQRSQRSTVSGCIAHAEQVLTTFPFESMTDGANDRSSLSTGELNRQIQDAQRGFFRSTGDNSTASNTVAAAHPTSSPSKQKLSRRQTTVDGPSSAQTPPGSTKRTKTLTAYASGRTSRTPKIDNPAFGALHDDQADQRASQSPRFSDHSGSFGSERGLPHGTIEDDFAKHNPNVMFRDTGSTVAFNESSEQRMLEQALQDARQPVSSAAKLAESEQNPSSPAWLWAHTTQSPHSNQSKKSVRHDADSIKDATEQANKVLEPVEPPQQDLAAATSKPAEYLAQDDRKTADVSQRQASVLPKSSPQVIVHTNGTPEETSLGTITQESHRGRKRKPSNTNQEASSEPFDSEDLLVGLPKERYQPKPSRRRMTELPEEPIDYSVVPERAAKKRRKTLNDASANSEHIDKTITQSVKASEKQWTSKTSKRDQAVSSKPRNMSAPGTPEQPAAANAGSPPRPVASPLTSPETKRAKQSPIKVAVPPAKPSPSPSKMGPPSLPASSMKKKVPRSHTTIFEDCSRSSQKSPSLSQQQADRRSALQGPGKRKAPANKPRRRIVQDDEDDEDELSKEVEKEALASKRDRPAKVHSHKTIAAKRGSNHDLDDDGEDDEAPRKRERKAKSTEQILEDSDAENEIVATESVKKGRKSMSAEKVLDDSAAEDIVEPNAEDEPQPSKKKRGRPAKSKADAALTSASKADEDNTANAATASASRVSAGDSNVLKAKDTNTLPKAKEATPVPDSGISKEDTAQQPRCASKPGPTTHSPIKKTSKILNHRVGLNKKSRIPPLLKIVRPQQRKEVERVTKVISVAELERMAAAKLEE
ncbi:hypothetical protein AC578_267 [Pseudocercospora eumusae]|uniref:Uncharacterized protein n=1 Tax=Pseudocercospora eumusae TaxID=321146 RepID=A0A139H785_9PEZI|nr:hypothetical protein AC578_267 [Pseudocercospora eumusae]